eukprot:1214396-Amphidinium_carterae.1
MKGKPNDADWVLTPYLRAQYALAGWAARCAAGLHKRPAPSSVGQSQPETSRRIKLNNIVSQTKDEEVNIIGSDVISAGYRRYRNLFGGFPPPDQEVSDEQLSALHALLESGQAPYVDFSVWVPHSQRLLKKIKLQGMHFTGTGELRQVELSGPLSYELWGKSYLCLRTALIMLDVVTLGKLDAYATLIRQYSARYSSCWSVVVEAD